jgi:hypothetical protein
MLSIVRWSLVFFTLAACGEERSSHRGESDASEIEAAPASEGFDLLSGADVAKISATQACGAVVPAPIALEAGEGVGLAVRFASGGLPMSRCRVKFDFTVDTLTTLSGKTTKKRKVQSLTVPGSRLRKTYTELRVLLPNHTTVKYQAFFESGGDDRVTVFLRAVKAVGSASSPVDLRPYLAIPNVPTPVFSYVFAAPNGVGVPVRNDKSAPPPPGFAYIGGRWDLFLGSLMGGTINGGDGFAIKSGIPLPKRATLAASFSIYDILYFISARQPSGQSDLVFDWVDVQNHKRFAIQSRREGPAGSQVNALYCQFVNVTAGRAVSSPFVRCGGTAATGGYPTGRVTLLLDGPYVTAAVNGVSLPTHTFPDPVDQGAFGLHAIPTAFGGTLNYGYTAWDSITLLNDP